MSFLSADGALTDAARNDASGGSHAPAAHGSQWGLHGHADEMNAHQYLCYLRRYRQQLRREQSNDHIHHFEL